MSINLAETVCIRSVLSRARTNRRTTISTDTSEIKEGKIEKKSFRHNPFTSIFNDGTDTFVMQVVHDTRYVEKNIQRVL